MNNKIASIVIIALVYVLSTGVSYAFFTQGPLAKKQTVKTQPPVAKTAEGKVAFDESLPKTEPCPLNGQLFSKQQKEWWEEHRPLGVMVENHEDARPQSGLSFADVIYEAVAEGGITRFLVVYHCQDAGHIGPVRSARTYFLDWISEYGNNPLYAHVGGANTPGPADALSQIGTYGWKAYNDLNQFSIGCPVYCQDLKRIGRDVAIEHTMYSTTSKLWEFAKNKRKLTNVDEDGVSWDEKFIEYTFKEDMPVGERPASQTINLQFWEGYSQYFVDWKFDPKTNLYTRYSAGKLYVDNNTKNPVTAKNVVVLFMQESNANDGYENNLHLLYRNKGSGKALVFLDGERITATWKKNSRTARTLLFDSSGEQIAFDRGVIWFEILPTNGEVTVN